MSPKVQIIFFLVQTSLRNSKFLEFGLKIVQSVNHAEHSLLAYTGAQCSIPGILHTRNVKK